MAHDLHSDRVARMADPGRLGCPFVAFVNRPGLGGHALLVLKAKAAQVWVVDPLSGAPDTLPRGEFVAEWDPVVVWVEPPGG